MISYGDIYKPYPYVFVSGRKPSGIGHSGPGGLLWPMWPPTDGNVTKNPVIPLVIDQSLSDMSMSVGDQSTWKTEISINAGSGSIFSELSSVAQIVMVDGGDELFDMDVDQESITAPESVDVYVVFARSKDTLSIGELSDSMTVDTVPFSILLSTSGSLSRYIDYSDKTESILFDNLIYKVTLSQNDGWNISGSTWLYSTVYSNILVTASNGVLRLQTPVIAISHPEKTGYLSVYMGGLMSISSSVRSFYIRSTGCSTVMGPSWYPHTTFFPLVEVYRDELPILKDWLEVNGTDLTYAEETPGYGIIRRDRGTKAAEHLVAYQGELLYAPLKSWNRGYSSFQPDAVDTRIIQDSCIYPVVGRLDTERMDAFTTSWTNATKPFN